MINRAFGAAHGGKPLAYRRQIDTTSLEAQPPAIIWLRRLNGKPKAFRHVLRQSRGATATCYLNHFVTGEIP